MEGSYRVPRSLPARGPRLPAWAAAAALLLLSGCAALAQLGAGALTRPLRVPVLGEPATPHRTLRFTTADGLQLEGWLFSPAGTPRGLVVFLHGKDINRQHFSDRVGPFLERGYAVLAYDQRAHGRSEGERTTYGVREVEDLRGILDRLALAPVVLIGESLGAAVALQAGARDPRVAAVVAGASFSDLPTVVRELTPCLFPEAVAAESRRLAEEAWGFHLEDVSPARDAAALARPVLLLHGLEDRYIVPAHAIRILERLPGPKRLLWLAGVGHVDVLLHDRAWAAILEWFDGLPPPPGP